MSSISSLLGGSSTDLRQSLFSKLDTDGSGTISKDEFVSNRPKNISEDQASSLYAKIDSGNTNALTSDQLDAGLKANRPDKSASTASTQSGDTSSLLGNLSSEIMAVLLQLSQQAGDATTAAASGTDAASASTDGTSFAQDLFKKIDADGDGKITQDEFVAARPDGVTADQASAAFKKLDKDGTGSIDETQFAQDVKAHGHHGHHGGPPPADTDSDSDNELSDTTVTSDPATATSTASSVSGADSSTSTETALLQLLQAVQSYANTYSNNKASILQYSATA